MKIILAEPRGFCAGVRRAIEIVELALQKFGPPIYVNHEIVHNKFIVSEFEKKGVIFLQDLLTKNLKEGSYIIYSAHGVSDAVEEYSKKHNLISIDATCPLVKKVHREVTKYDNMGYTVILVGHKNHIELQGTAGRIKGDVLIVETIEDAFSIKPKDETKVTLATQTTLSLDDTKDIVDILKKRFPCLNQHSQDDICYATQNRQNAVKDIIKDYKIDTLFVVGSKNSSNSNRLCDIGTNLGVKSFLIDDKNDILETMLQNTKTIGITAGASAPDDLIYDLVSFLQEKLSIPSSNTIFATGVKEDIIFHSPKIVRV